MPFSNPVVAGETLVIPGVQSDNYVAGVAGWRIERAGNADFNDISVRGSLEVTGSIDPDSKIAIHEAPLTGFPVIEFTSNSGIVFTLVANASDGLRFRGSDPDDPSMYIVDQFGVAFTRASGAGVLFDDSGYFVAGSYTPFVAETWQALTGQNGWTRGGAGQRPQCRKMPDGTVMCRGIFTPGTTTNGTIITTLPSGYAPQQESRFIVADTGTGTAFRHINVQTNGDVLVFNAATGGGATSLDAVRFALPALGAGT